MIRIECSLLFVVPICPIITQPILSTFISQHFIYKVPRSDHMLCWSNMTWWKQVIVFVFLRAGRINAHGRGGAFHESHYGCWAFHIDRAKGNSNGGIAHCALGQDAAVGQPGRICVCQNSLSTTYNEMTILSEESRWQAQTHSQAPNWTIWAFRWSVNGGNSQQQHHHGDQRSGLPSRLTQGGCFGLGVQFRLSWFSGRLLWCNLPLQMWQWMLYTHCRQASVWPYRRRIFQRCHGWASSRKVLFLFSLWI